MTGTLVAERFGLGMDAAPWLGVCGLGPMAQGLQPRSWGLQPDLRVIA